MLDRSAILQCPECIRKLTHGSAEGGSLWFCGICTGAFVSFGALARMSSSVVVERIQSAAEARGSAGIRPCPNCSLAMTHFTTERDDASLTLDLCAKCEAVWFDKQELGALPGARAPKTHHPSVDLEEKYEGFERPDGDWTTLKTILAIIVVLLEIFG